MQGPIFRDHRNKFMSTEWFVEWFNSPYYEILYKNRDQQEARRLIDRLVLQFNIPFNKRILDLACGKGRHAHYLAQQGFEVTGLDLSGQKIEYAKQFETPRLSFFEHDMRKPFRVNYFDYTFNLFTSFGYFAQREDHIRSLRYVAQGLKEQGIFILDFFNSFLIKQQKMGLQQIQLQNIDFEVRKKVDGRFVFKNIKIHDQGQYFTFEERVELFFLEDFLHLLRETGFEVINTFGDYQLNPFDEAISPRLILAAQKI